MAHGDAKKTVRILVTGGGTGGHVAPALAVIQTIRARPGIEPIFLYVGSRSGVEARLAREANIPFSGIQTGKMRRYLSIRNVFDAFRVPVGVVQALGIVGRFRPDVVFGTGGYVSIPSVFAAGIRKIPVLTHEQTVTVGLANKLAGRFATRIALSFEGAIDELPAPLRKKAFVTGNPVREVLFQGDRDRAVDRFGFSPDDDSLPTIYVTGGAQGARVLNRSIESAMGDLLDRARIVHQCGNEEDFSRLTTAAGSLDPIRRRRYFVTRFVGDEIGDVYALADLIVARSGAGTVTEACALGKPAVFVPLVPTGGDEQTRNAQRSVDAGGAVILKSAECDGPRLLAVVAPLLADRARLERMGGAARTLARPAAAEDLADALLNLAP